jgi:hypothetical protein
MTLTPGVHCCGRLSDRDLASCAFCFLAYARILGAKLSAGAQTWSGRLRRIDSITDACNGSATPPRCDVQFVPFCNRAACNLNVEFRQSINALLQCVSLCLKIRRNLLRTDSETELHRGNNAARFLSQPRNRAVIAFKL